MDISPAGNSLLTGFPEWEYVRCLNMLVYYL
jgi:hypothetical protein